MERVRIKKNFHSSIDHKLRVKTGAEPAQANVQQVLVNPGSATPADFVALQQTAGNAAVTGWVESPAWNEPPNNAGGNLDNNFSAAIQKQRGTGMPLPPDLREEMSHSLGTDFGKVRLHTNDQADNLSQSIQARAFTVGSDIFFRQDAFAPDTPEGKRILKHELTHVVQQGGVSSSRLRLGPVNDTHEQEAGRLSHSEASHPLASRPDTTAPAGAVQRFFFPWQQQKMKKLGGSMNTVFRVQHKAGNVGYLKPNSEDDPGMGARSVLSSSIDQSLGLNALAHETYQNYGGGKEGSESGEVRGKEIHENEFNTPISKQEYLAGMQSEPTKFKERRSGPFGLRKKYFKLSATQYNRHDFTNPTTQKSLANIQLQDAITGQFDRHGGNIKINPETHEAKGYDSDLIDIKNSDRLTRMQGLHKPGGGAALTPEQEAVRQTKRADALKAVNPRYGKQVGLPSHIDQTAAQRMVGMKSRDFIADLHARDPENMARLKPESIEEMKNRYSSVRRYAKAGMASAGLVADPTKAAKWSSPAYQETVRKGAGMVPHIVGAGGWNQQTYNEQVSQYAGPRNHDYNSYLQRSVLNYNDIQQAGGSIPQDDMHHKIADPSTGQLPTVPMQGPPVPAVVPHPPAPPPPPPPPVDVAPPAPEVVHHPPALPPPPPPPPAPVHDAGPGRDNVRRLREMYENIGRR